MPADIMTPEEVADYLRLNRETVYRNLRQGRLPGIKVGAQWRVSRSALDNALCVPDLYKQSIPPSPCSSEKNPPDPNYRPFK
jgi:excisionase family DNA binding protein